MVKLGLFMYINVIFVMYWNHLFGIFHTVFLLHLLVDCGYFLKNLALKCNIKNSGFAPVSAFFIFYFFFVCVRVCVFVVSFLS